jgi:hypothetical protein
VVVRHVTGHADNSAYPAVSVDIDLRLTTPAGARGVPVIVEFFPVEWASRMPPQPRPTWQEQVIQRGWAYAILSPSSIQADNGAGLTKGIIGLVNKGQPRKPDDWGALKAWAWGASRALDYLQSNPEIALWQGFTGDTGVRATLRVGLHRILGRGWRGTGAPPLGRNARERGGQRRIPLDGRQLHQVRS